MILFWVTYTIGYLFLLATLFCTLFIIYLYIDIISNKSSYNYNVNNRLTERQIGLQKIVSTELIYIQ